MSHMGTGGPEFDPWNPCEKVDMVAHARITHAQGSRGFVSERFGHLSNCSGRLREIPTGSKKPHQSPSPEIMSVPLGNLLRGAMEVGA